MEKYICHKCACDITYEEVSEGYFGVCLDCDEDFYKFELEKVNEEQNKKESDER